MGDQRKRRAFAVVPAPRSLRRAGDRSCDVHVHTSVAVRAITVVEDVGYVIPQKIPVAVICAFQDCEHVAHRRSRHELPQPFGVVADLREVLPENVIVGDGHIFDQLGTCDVGQRRDGAPGSVQSLHHRVAPARLGATWSSEVPPHAMNQKDDVRRHGSAPSVGFGTPPSL
jgi:hypothetical protein